MTAAEFVEHIESRIAKARARGRVELHVSLDEVELLAKLGRLGTSVHAEHKAALAKLGDALDRGDALARAKG